MSNERASEEKIRQMGFDVASALKRAKRGEIEAWVHEYLLSGSGGSTNRQFSDGLKLEKRWWYGPVALPLSDLTRAVGTEPDREYVVDADYWKKITSRMAASFTDLRAFPPVVVEYRDGELSVRDGNTRLGAMELLGWETCWAVIWFNSEEEYLQHNNSLS